MLPVKVFKTSVPKALTNPSGVCNSKGILLTKLSISTGAVAIPCAAEFYKISIFSATPLDIMLAGVPSPK